MINHNAILFKICLILLILFMYCISEDVDIDVEYKGVLGYGDLVEVVVNHKNHTFRIDNITAGSSETYSFNPISDILLEFEYNGIIESAIEIPNYFLAIPFSYQGSQDIILAIPSMSGKYNVDQIAKNYLYYDADANTFGSVVLRDDGTIEFSEVDPNTALVRTSYGIFQDNFDGTLNIQSSEGDFTVYGTAVAFGGETLIIDKGIGNGFIFGVKESADLTFESIVGDYFLIYLITYQNGTQLRVSGDLSIVENGNYSITINGIYTFSGSLDTIIGGSITSYGLDFPLQGMVIPSRLISFYSSCVHIEGLPDTYNDFEVFIVGAKVD